MYSAVIFDLDGTLVDNTEQIFESFKQALIRIGYQPPKDRKLKQLLGRSMDKMIESLSVSESHTQEFVEHYIDSINQYPPYLVDQIESLLNWLKPQTNMAIVTSKLSTTTDHVMDQLGLGKYFKTIITADSVKNTKPHPEPLLTACEVLQVVPNKRVVYIGDNDTDIIAARKAGISAIGVTWGVKGTKLKSYHDCVVSSIKELKQKLIDAPDC